MASCSRHLTKIAAKPTEAFPPARKPSASFLKRLRRMPAWPALIALSLYAGYGVSPARAETAGDRNSLPVELFVDVVSDKFADATASDDATEIALGGLPLTVGRRAGIEDAGWGMTAGVKGEHVIPLADKLSLVASAVASKTHYIDDVSLGTANATGGAELRYDDGDLLLALRSSLGIAARTELGDQVDYAINGRMSKGVIAGLSVTASTGYAWRQSHIAESDSGEIALGSLGLSYRFAGDLKLDLKYLFQRKAADEARYSSSAQGPSIAASLPLGDRARLTASYRYSAASLYDQDGSDLDPRQDDLQVLGVTADWNLGGEAMPGLDLKADYRYKGSVSTGDGPEYMRQAGTLSMALRF